MLVWCGQSWPTEIADEGAGAAYDPVTDSWRKLPMPPISRRAGQVATFTGSEMLIWGGDRNGHQIDGAAYNPEKNSWRPLPPSPLVSSAGVIGAWTGKEWLLVQAGWPEAPQRASGQGAAYDPATNSWRRIADARLRPAWAAAAVWTGVSLVIISFSDDGASGGQYDPAANRWSRVPENPGLGLQAYPFATMTSQGILMTRDTIQNSSGIQAEPAAWTYNPTTFAWRTLAAPPSQLPYGPPVYTGDSVIYYGCGGDRSWAYSPEHDRWFAFAPSHDRMRESWTSVWTGREMLIWGGSNPAGDFSSDGWRLLPTG
jgi:hypothetical protein